MNDEEKKVKASMKDEEKKKMTWVIAYVVATHAMLSTEKGNTPDNTDLLATAFANRMTQTILEKLS